ncbi:uncharacterized protein LOC115984327 isoform X3 [Quercus lobata]|uniref:uncharacterized protein LOC115984327 isoform X3 n=1 Tax=Quercus lobata TaxID=97700 RepID=UPI00124906BA|nr:uncharacterized protein LOC115984327 isoform X3 [Quercus lobata]
MLFFLSGSLLLRTSIPDWSIDFFQILQQSTCRNYNEATGVIRPRHIHGDKCRCPSYSSLLGAVLGVGTQQFIIHLQYSWDQIMQYGQSIDDSETTRFIFLVFLVCTNLFLLKVNHMKAYDSL